MKPFQKVRRYIERHALLEGARGVVVAVSGGPDSVALLDMLMHLTAGTGDRGPGASSGAGGQGSGAGQGMDEVMSSLEDSASLQSLPGLRPPAPGPHLYVAHLNHKLRGVDSDADAEF